VLGGQLFALCIFRVQYPRKPAGEALTRREPGEAGASTLPARITAAGQSGSSVVAALFTFEEVYTNLAEPSNPKFCKVSQDFLWFSQRTRKGQGNDMTLDDLLTAQEVADYLGLHLVTVRDMLREGKLPGRKVGREWRVLESELMDWLRKLESPANDEQQKSRVEQSRDIVTPTP